MDHQQLESFKRAALAAAQAAALVIREGYGGDFSVTTKADRTPVTDVDVAAERAIRSVLEARFPAHGFYGEETGQNQTESDYLWLVDPIDGTKAFVRGYPFFSTQIALMYRGELIVGVSSAPMVNEVAWATKGGGAWLNDARIAIGDTASIEDAAVSLGNTHRLAASAAWPRLGGIVARCDRIRGYGDFLHYHLLASGRIDAVIESDVNILDIAALTVVVSEAGGVMTQLDGSPIDLQTTDILAANVRLHRQLASELGDLG
ncbi:MAG: inositol monophosphatase family protein [Pseudomonadota bacterium]